MAFTANRYPATEEKTTLRDKPTFMSCFRSEAQVFKEVLVLIVIIKFIKTKLGIKILDNSEKSMIFLR